MTGYSFRIHFSVIHIEQSLLMISSIQVFEQMFSDHFLLLHT
jgi:hypothetical protein